MSRRPRKNRSREALDNTYEAGYNEGYKDRDDEKNPDQIYSTATLSTAGTIVFPSTASTMTIKSGY